MDRTAQERFWSKIDQRGPDECWEWTAGRIWTGYGHFRIEGTKKIASRLMWELVNGPIPEGLKVLHKCDNPPCCNPSHLFLGTQKDNMRDCAAKGRHGLQRHPERVRGSRGHSAKLNEWQVVGAMARWLMGETQESIAADLGVRKEAVSKITRVARWSHLFEEEWA